MWYIIGLPLLAILCIAIVVDIQRRKKKNKWEQELKDAKELGEVQFYRGMNNHIEHSKNNHGL